MRNQKGFSLIELILVVSVILIISAIAVPNFLRSRMRANEASCSSSIRAIDTAAITYSVAYPDVGFPATLNLLGGAGPCSASPASACMIDDNLAQGAKSGYAFVWVGDGATPSVSFTIAATPQAPGSSGQSTYCSDQTAVIHFDFTGAPCTNASQVLQ
ncbi:MAG TPA: type II secretion system protein [Candidatus Acidoferrum sp.]|nr:type II secretion system protein [Candidatus Acidoferrum sp.]